MDTLSIIQFVEQNSTYDKDKSKSLGEVFTPGHLINDMLDQLPEEVWSDPNKTWFDPCAGKGNFPAHIAHRLMEGLSDAIPNEDDRYRHIMENMIYMAEYQEESAAAIQQAFNANGDISLNLYVGDSLNIPEDYWSCSSTL